MFGIVLLLLIGIGEPTVVECEQWFIDADRNPFTGYQIGGVGAEVICDVHGNVRSVFGGTGPGGWGGVIPATVAAAITNPFPLSTRSETYDCAEGCQWCEKSGTYLLGVDYGCEGHPRDEWPSTDKADLRHMAEWINCYGR